MLIMLTCEHLSQGDLQVFAWVCRGRLAYNGRMEPPKRSSDPLEPLTPEIIRRVLQANASKAGRASADQTHTSTAPGTGTTRSAYTVAEAKEVLSKGRQYFMLHFFLQNFLSNLPALGAAAVVWIVVIWLSLRQHRAQERTSTARKAELADELREAYGPHGKGVRWLLQHRQMKELRRRMK